MYLNLGISMILKNFKLSRIENIDFDISVDSFKNRVAEEINFPKEAIELTYCGTILEDSSTLKSNGLREGFVVNVMQKKERANPATSLPVSDETGIQELVRVFQILATRNAYRRVLQKLNKPEVLENIISTTPGLSEDPIAVVILQHPELIAKLGDLNAVEKVVEQHPSLAYAARNLVAAVQSEVPTSPSTSASAANLSNNISYVVGSDDEEMEIMGNGDSQNRTLESSDDGEQPVNLITTSQVAAALANTSALGTAGRSSGGAISNITPEMMSAALQQAIASTSTASTPSTASASTSTSTPTETKEDSPVTLAKLEELRKLGFTNDAMNIQALQIANGDLETAVNLILCGLNEDN